jgi:DNA-binding PadR family transcriptional regulator
VSLKYAVLGLVIERPSHGRDVAARLAMRLPSMAPALSAVYAVLDELRAERLLCPADATAHVPRHARRLVYKATPGGMDRFDAWMNTPSSRLLPSEELQWRVAVAQPRNLKRLIEFTYEQERLCFQEIMESGPRASAEELRASELIARGDVWQTVGQLLAREVENVRFQAALEMNARVRELLRWAESLMQEDAGDPD